MVLPDGTMNLTPYVSSPYKRTDDCENPLPETLIRVSPAFQFLTKTLNFSPVLCRTTTSEQSPEGNVQAATLQPHLTSLPPQPPSSIAMSPTRSVNMVETWYIDYQLPHGTILEVGQDIHLACAGSDARTGIISCVSGYTNSDIYFFICETAPKDFNTVIYLAVPIQATNLAKGLGLNRVQRWALSSFCLQQRPLGDQAKKEADDKERLRRAEESRKRREMNAAQPKRTEQCKPNRPDTQPTHGERTVALSGAAPTSAINLGHRARTPRRRRDSPEKSAVRAKSTTTLRSNATPESQTLRLRSFSDATRPERDAKRPSEDARQPE
ncbi:hypothetical protein BKA70DRAFT_1226871 [Coprinopsis sp. MPI-PUGE-AT-0042]|nr:hypothetical protein BKA70DRAFT_1226871 [Coprinopsis sp. MPI-PUGE-AT-0042]